MLRAILRRDRGVPFHLNWKSSVNPLENFRIVLSLVPDNTDNNLFLAGWNNDLVGSFAVYNLHLGVVVHRLTNTEDDFVGVNFLAECHLFCGTSQIFIKESLNICFCEISITHIIGSFAKWPVELGAHVCSTTFASIVFNNLSHATSQVKTSDFSINNR